MSDELTRQDAERAAEMVMTIVTSYPALVSAISDDDAALVRRAINEAEAQIRSAETLMPILAAHGIGDDLMRTTKALNIRIVRAVLDLRDVVMQGIAVNQRRRDALLAAKEATIRRDFGRFIR